MQLLQELAEGINIKLCDQKEICECCVKGKLARKPFPQWSETTTEEILDLIHTDICGPMQTSTPIENRYIMTIIDFQGTLKYIF